MSVLIAAILAVRHFWFDDFLAHKDAAARAGILALYPFGTFGLSILYFAITEGLWGASLGKTLCSLRIVRDHGEGAGIAKALIRALVFWFVFRLDNWITLACEFSGESNQVLHSLLRFVPFGSLAVMFSTARRKNGFAGIHDLSSRTRAIQVPEHHPRHVPQSHAQPLLSNNEATPKVGPYHVLGSLTNTETDEVLLGYDTRLLRQVWIRKLPAGTPPVGANLRHLGRLGRLRWLNGKRTSQECWDAYEVPSGQSILKMIEERQPWSLVRVVLLDLAQELDASRTDQTLPAVLGLDRVWITADGRAKLLDFPAPGTNDRLSVSQSCTLTGSKPAATQIFLNQVAIAALEGRMVSPEEALSCTPAVPLPLHARIFLDDLHKTNVEDPAVLLDSGVEIASSRPAPIPPERLLGQLKSLLDKPAVVSRRRRLGLLVGCLLWTTLMSGFSLMYTNDERVKEFENERKMLGPLAHCLGRLEALEKRSDPPGSSQAQQRQALEIYIAGHFRHVFIRPYGRVLVSKRTGSEIGIRDEPVKVPVGGLSVTTVYATPFWFSLYARSYISGDLRKLALRIWVAHPNPSEKELSEATAPLQRFLATIAAKPESSLFALIAPFQVADEREWFRLATLSLACALLFRGGPLLHLLGIAVVTTNGAKASRLRIFARNVIAWSPLLLIHFLILQASGPLWSICLVFTFFVTGAIWAVWEPTRGLQDRLAGTWLVPR